MISACSTVEHAYDSSKDRLETYDKCRAQSQTNDDLDGCMNDHGYAFVPETDLMGARNSECWDDRYSHTLPPAYCYYKLAGMNP